MNAFLITRTNMTNQYADNKINITNMCKKK